MQTNVRPGRRLSTKLLTGLCGSCADRSLVVVFRFLSFDGVADISWFDSSDSNSPSSLMLFWSLDSGFQARFLVDGEVLDLSSLGICGVPIRDERRKPSSSFMGEYLNSAIRALKTLPTRLDLEGRRKWAQSYSDQVQPASPDVEPALQQAKSPPCVTWCSDNRQCTRGVVTQRIVLLGPLSVPLRSLKE